MRQYTGWFCFVLLLGAVIGFAAGKWDTKAEAQSVDNKTTRWLAGTVTYGQALDAFLLFDSQTNRLMAYSITGNKKLELIAVRDVSYDAKPVSFGKQEPTVQQMKEDFERAEKERLDREKEKKDK
jgi:hypothetical protein